MKKLLYKDFTLSIHFFYSLIMPLLAGALFLIPQWPYYIALMYFFWITIPNYFGMKNAQKDNEFTIILPVSKKEMAQSTILSVLILQGAHLILAVIFSMIHIAIYGSQNFMLNLNPAFFGLALIMYGLFNITFFPMYYKTAYRYGFPSIAGIVITLLYAVAVEALVLLNPIAAAWLEGSSQSQKLFQFMVLLAGIVFFVFLNLLAMKISVKRLENVDL